MLKDTEVVVHLKKKMFAVVHLCFFQVANSLFEQHNISDLLSNTINLITKYHYYHRYSFQNHDHLYHYFHLHSF